MPFKQQMLKQKHHIKAKISSSSINSKEKINIGVSETKFKLWYAIHKKSFTSFKPLTVEDGYIRHFRNKFTISTEETGAKKEP